MSSRISVWKAWPALFALILLAACGGTAAPTLSPAASPTATRAAPTAAPTETASITPTVVVTATSIATQAPTEVAATSTTAAQAEWLTTELVNARTGETFRLADFRGKTVLLEMMAVW